MPDRARVEARELGVPLTVVSEPDRALRELYEAPFVLIRPDQHVAWRGTIRPEQPRALLGASPTGTRSPPGFQNDAAGCGEPRPTVVGRVAARTCLRRHVTRYR
ncbi:aromatic-ring hydroxylase C-terminal domain-containing protein [Chelatococcus sambhunathii]|uniref:aromatic-ring hydroxylase C-terminal domain-containing protein n=1 Tax=Chelatococcus sambhunathii TaxID=363953 RepID=UPI00315A00A4